MLYQKLTLTAAAVILALGVVVGTSLYAQEQAPPAKPGGDGMMGHDGMQGGMMDQDSMMTQMRQMMKGCSKMMQAQATPPTQPPSNGKELQPQPRG